MLNYIWAGLIIFSLVFAMVYDVRDMANDTYRNGDPLPVVLSFPESYDSGTRRQEVTVSLPEGVFNEHYGVDHEGDLEFQGVLLQTTDGAELRFAQGIDLPEPLGTIRSHISRRENDLRGPVIIAGSDSTSAEATVLFNKTRFLKLTAISQAALDFAETAVTLAIGLIGALALWMGLLRIAEKSGILYSLVRFTQPVLKKLFPEIPEDHPAFGMIVLNLTANMLGLGNAATPLGIKAMEELQKLNPTEDTATNSMVMLLALNTASVQIVPPVLLVAIMGLQINQLFFSILIVTSMSATIAVLTAKLFSRFKKHKATDPMRIKAGESEEVK
ncbi:MAG: nucleoside recognition protein [Rhodothermales bacterium]|nr:nucleoside recognition protein [Rhodothermales bacterium]